jgi:hypothetical protein
LTPSTWIARIHQDENLEMKAYYNSVTQLDIDLHVFQDFLLVEPEGVWAEKGIYSIFQAVERILRKSSGKIDYPGIWG